jgi:hypothetical protein
MDTLVKVVRDFVLCARCHDWQRGRVCNGVALCHTCQGKRS